MSTNRVNAKSPAAAPATVATGLLMAIILLAVAVVFIHDALVSAGAVSGTAWLAWFAEKANVISASSPWMLWAGPLAVVIGLVLVIAALKPRKSTHWAVGDQGVFIGRGDTARLAANAAHSTPAVVDAQASVSGRSTLRVTGATISTDAQRSPDRSTRPSASDSRPSRPGPLSVPESP